MHVSRAFPVRGSTLSSSYLELPSTLAFRAQQQCARDRSSLWQDQDLPEPHGWVRQRSHHNGTSELHGPSPRHKPQPTSSDPQQRVLQHSQQATSSEVPRMVVQCSHHAACSQVASSEIPRRLLQCRHHPVEACPKGQRQVFRFLTASKSNFYPI